MYALTFKATVYQTNAAGQIVSTQMTEKTWLEEVAPRIGVTDISTLAVVYYEKANAMGDAIHVINASTGDVWTELFGFYFGTSYGRMPLVSPAGERRIDYIYTAQNTRSLGTALIFKDISSNSNKVISGQMRYLITPDGTNNTTLRLVNGNFRAGPLLKF